MFTKFKRLRDKAPLKSSYDAVIIGGGLNGLATAYYLARNHGIKNVAVIEKRHIGFGGAGRNTAIVRANQRTKENLPLYDEGLKLWPKLTAELDFNLMFNNCGNLNLAHSILGTIEEKMREMTYDLALLLTHYPLLGTNLDLFMNSRRLINFVNSQKIEFVFCGHSHCLRLENTYNLYTGHRFYHFMCGTTASSNIMMGDDNMFLYYANIGDENFHLYVIRILRKDGHLEFKEEKIR